MIMSSSALKSDFAEFGFILKRDKWISLATIENFYNLMQIYNINFMTTIVIYIASNRYQC